MSLSFSIQNGSITAEDPAGEPAMSFKGTLLQVAGSPFTGFLHAFERGTQICRQEHEGGGIEQLLQHGRIRQEILVSSGKGSTATQGEEDPGRLIERHAARVPPPNVTKRPWIAVSPSLLLGFALSRAPCFRMPFRAVRDGQHLMILRVPRKRFGTVKTDDLHRRDVVGAAFVEAVKAHIDSPVALMPAPLGSQAFTQQQSILTASIGPGSFASLPRAPPKAEKMEWDRRTSDSGAGIGGQSSGSTSSGAQDGRGSGGRKRRERKEARSEGVTGVGLLST